MAVCAEDNYYFATGKCAFSTARLKEVAVVFAEGFNGPALEADHEITCLAVQGHANAMAGIEAAGDFSFGFRNTLVKRVQQFGPFGLVANLRFAKNRVSVECLSGRRVRWVAKIEVSRVQGKQNKPFAGFEGLREFS
jgi:hypothetical protein